MTATYAGQRMQEMDFASDELPHFSASSYHILDALPGQPYDDIVHLATLVCDAPMATITLVDSQRIWRKSSIGLPPIAAQLSKEQAFAAQVVLNPQAILVIEDTVQHARFAKHPYVQGEHAVRFYAGVPIVTAQGEALGALGVMDVRARTLSAAQGTALQRLARQVAALLEVRQRTELEAERVFRENQYLQALTFTGLDLQSVVDRDYRYRYVNQVYLEYWRKSREEIEGRTVADLIGQQQFDEYVKGYLDRAMEGEQVTVDANVRYPLLGDRYVRSSFLPARNKQGHIIGAVLRVEDISDLREVELSLRHTVHLLEEKKLDLQRFIYILSHDLREPVNTIMNFSGLLREQFVDHEDEQVHRFLDFVYKGGDRMRNLLEDLLKYVRVDSNQPARVAVSLDAMFQEVSQDLSAILQRTGTQLSCEPLPVVHGDPIMLRVLLQNLIENAIKFVAPDVVPRIQITAMIEADAWRLTVTDNGVGVRDEHRELIFELFKRLHSRKHYEGTGLGLATCRRIAELHGGRIWVTSAPHQGSCFHVQLPRRNNN
ncbi:MAG: ATP-binding protein [Steroidobacteraceae bacterium]